jgi:transcriptional regulator with XRE-family HTH domain
MQRSSQKNRAGIAELRRKRDFIREELAQGCGVHETYLSRVERAENHVSFAVMNRIAQALEISMSDLFNDL